MHNIFFTDGVILAFAKAQSIGCLPRKTATYLDRSDKMLACSLVNVLRSAQLAGDNLRLTCETMEASRSPGKDAMLIENAQDPLVDMARALLARPTFEAATRHYIAHVIQWRRGLGLYNRVGTEIGQHITYYVALLHFTQPADNPAAGATFSNILQICEKRGQCGSRALRTVLQVLRVMRLVTVRRAEGDGRVQVYEPTEAINDALREHLKQTMICLDLIVGVSKFGPMLEADHAFVGQLMSRSGRPYIDLDLQIVEAVPDLAALITLRGGCPTVFRLLQSHIDGVQPPSPQVIAREFKLSPSQVRNIIKTAEHMGLVIRRPDGTLDVSRLAERQRHMLARELALHAKYGLQVELPTTSSN